MDQVQELRATAFHGRLNTEGAREDVEMAFQWASYVCGDEAEMRAYIRYLAHKARLTVDVQWVRRAIRAMAERLVAQRRIPGRTARALIQRSWREWLEDGPVARQSGETRMGLPQ